MTSQIVLLRVTTSLCPSAVLNWIFTLIFILLVVFAHIRDNDFNNPLTLSNFSVCMRRPAVFKLQTWMCFLHIKLKASILVAGIERTQYWWISASCFVILWGLASRLISPTPPRGIVRCDSVFGVSSRAIIHRESPSAVIRPSQWSTGLSSGAA